MVWAILGCWRKVKIGQQELATNLRASYSSMLSFADAHAWIGFVGKRGLIFTKHLKIDKFLAQIWSF